VARSRSNVERVRLPLTIRHVVRGILVLAGVVGGIVVAWGIAPQSDLLAFDLALVRGALLGAVVGLGAAALVPLRQSPPPVVRPRPSGFDALRAELEAERARAAADPTGDAADSGGTAAPPFGEGTPTDPGEVTLR
jgi:hypothetical protein